MNKQYSISPIDMFNSIKELYMKIPYNIRLSIKDYFWGIFNGTLSIQMRLRRHLNDQNRSWPKEKRYTHGYFYQGLKEVGITGAKPS